MSKQLIVLITGANRGIGLALTRAYLERGDRVVATCRQPAKADELQAQNVCVFAITPGWVRTDMGGADAELDPATVAGEFVSAIDGLTMAQTSLWLDRHGAISEYAW